MNQVVLIFVLLYLTSFLFIDCWPGTIPSTFGRLSNLITLRLQNNKFSGMIHDELTRNNSVAHWCDAYESCNSANVCTDPASVHSRLNSLHEQNWRGPIALVACYNRYCDLICDSRRLGIKSWSPPPARFFHRRSACRSHRVAWKTWTRGVSVINPTSGWQCRPHRQPRGVLSACEHRQLGNYDDIRKSIALLIDRWVYDSKSPAWVSQAKPSQAKPSQAKSQCYLCNSIPVCR